MSIPFHLQLLLPSRSVGGRLKLMEVYMQVDIVLRVHVLSVLVLVER
jgi:hypothetical protein